MERPHREDAQQQIDTQAPEKAEGTWGDNGRDGLTSSKDLRATNGPEVRKTECCGKNLKKNFKSIGLAHL